MDNITQNPSSDGNSTTFSWKRTGLALFGIYAVLLGIFVIPDLMDKDGIYAGHVIAGERFKLPLTVHMYFSPNVLERIRIPYIPPNEDLDGFLNNNLFVEANGLILDSDVPLAFSRRTLQFSTLEKDPDSAGKFINTEYTGEGYALAAVCSGSVTTYATSVSLTFKLRDTEAMENELEVEPYYFLRSINFPSSPLLAFSKNFSRDKNERLDANAVQYKLPVAQNKFIPVAVLMGTLLFLSIILAIMADAVFIPAIQRKISEFF